MRNRYPGTCYRCGGHVEKGEGHFERHQGDWRTQHADCAIRAREINRQAEPACRECGAIGCNGECYGDDLMGSSG